MPDPSDQKNNVEDLSKKESLLTGRERMLNQAEQGFLKKATELNKKEDLINTLNRNNIKSSDDLRLMLKAVTEPKNEPTITEEEDMEEAKEQNTGDLQETLNTKLDEISEKVDQVTGPALRKERIAELKTYFDAELKLSGDKTPYSTHTYKLDPNHVIEQFDDVLKDNPKATISDYLRQYNSDIENIAKLGGLIKEEKKASDLSLGDPKVSSPDASGKAEKPDLSKMNEEEKEEYFIKEAMKKK